MKAFAAAVLVLMTMVGPAASEPSAPVREAQRWIALVDAGNYAESWSSSGTLFQLRVGKENWVDAVGATREPLGAVLSRKVQKEQQSKAMPGAPDGDYEVIEFATDFANKKAAIETVVLANQAAGWRVDGYFVK